MGRWQQEATVCVTSGYRRSQKSWRACLQNLNNGLCEQPLGRCVDLGFCQEGTGNTDKCSVTIKVLFCADDEVIYTFTLMKPLTGLVITFSGETTIHKSNTRTNSFNRIWDVGNTGTRLLWLRCHAIIQWISYIISNEKLIVPCLFSVFVFLWEFIQKYNTWPNQASPVPNCVFTNCSDLESTKTKSLCNDDSIILTFWPLQSPVWLDQERSQK